MPKDVDDEIDRIMENERRMGRSVKRSNVIIMLLNLGIEQYYKNKQKQG
ncbi:MAG: hypothetical protein QW334_00400 [Thermofilum sp.]